MKTIEQQLKHWVSVSTFNNADTIWLGHEAVLDVLERIEELKREVENEKNRADINFSVAQFLQKNASGWHLRSEELHAENEKLIEDIANWQEDSKQWSDLHAEVVKEYNKLREEKNITVNFSVDTSNAVQKAITQLKADLPYLVRETISQQKKSDGKYFLY